jgi:hypothetical protein
VNPSDFLTLLNFLIDNMNEGFRVVLTSPRRPTVQSGHALPVIADAIFFRQQGSEKQAKGF